MKVVVWNLLTALVASEVIFQPQNAANSVNKSRSSPLDISDLYDNRGFGAKPRDANFDGYYSCYPLDSIPPSAFVYNGFNFQFPQYEAAGNDNVISKGQTVKVPRGRYLRVSMLAAAETGLASGYVNASYADGSTTSASVLVPSWWSWPYPFGGDLVMPYFFDNQSTNYNRSNIFQTVNWLDGSKELTSLSLPEPSGSGSGPGGAAVGTRLHIFAISLLPAFESESSSQLQLEVQYGRTTQKWMTDTNKTQIVEVLVNNVGERWVLSEDTVNVTVISDGLETVKAGQIKRLRSGDQAMVEVGVVNKPNIKAGTPGSAVIELTGSNGSVLYQHQINATYGISPYESTYDSIYGHESPNWYNDAKYGIFIHWGVYSVPGWGNKGKNESYAEWYWWDLNSGPDTKDQTYEYHLKTYGANVVYDDFIANFSASKWNPKDWVDLFADAGAKYFVQVSKHHDGYAIFDIPDNVTNRTSVALHPHRDFVAELFAAAKKYQPQLHRAVYFSYPEWFHPDYKRFGFGSWPGGNATNPYTNVTLPYTGYVPVQDFITDLQVPELEVLAYNPSYEIEILWCDIGGPNHTTEFASQWFNRAAEQGRQVSMNARCGLPGDFDTPEYARYGSVQRRKWESNLGLDPFSYGYNRATPAAAYMNASSVVTSLVDIVSKNGNFLLDIGPRADGTVVDVEVETLTTAGKWINGHEEAIFGTTYWFVGPQYEDTQSNVSVRFTQTMDAFYIHVLNPPEEKENARMLEICDVPLPWTEGDQVKIVGGKMNGTVVQTEKCGVGVRLNTTEAVWKSDEYVWVFKIEF